MAATDSEFTGLDDARLILLIQAGDTSAFRYLYEVMFPQLLRFAYQAIGSREVAEDAVQSVFLSVWVNRSHWNPACSIQAYLYRAVRNYTLDTLRHTQLVARVEVTADPDAPYGMGAAPPASDVTAEVSDEVRSLAAAIRILPERQRTAILLRWHDEMPVAAIAEVMDISRQGVEKLLRTAQARLRNVLGEHRMG